MSELRTPEELRQMEPAGRFVADTLARLIAEVAVGDNLLEIDAEAHRLIREAGAESCYLDYHPSFGASPFGHVICTSVNDGVLHGLPHDYALLDGDLLTLDFAVSVDGWVADSAITVSVGEPRPGDQALVDVTQRALTAGIKAAVAGNRIGDIAHAIGKVCKRSGHRVNLQFGGHGVGRTMHGDPHIPNDGKPRKGELLRPGLVIAIEPWILAATNEIRTDPDGWTLRSVDGSRGAHSEHTIAITEDGPLVLTARADGIGIPDNAILPEAVAAH